MRRTAASLRCRLVALLVVLPLAVTGALVATSLPASAAYRTFSQVFAANTTGDILLRGNTLLTCPVGSTSGSTTCAQAQNGTGANETNNSYLMGYVDTDSDSSTFDSSSSTVTIPSGATVLFAALTWGGDTAGSTSPGLVGAAAPNASVKNIASFKAPGATSYSSVTSTQTDTNGSTYQGYADVTDKVQAAGSGVYAVGNVQAGTGGNDDAGWSLAIAYRDPTQPARNLDIYSGFANVASGGGTADITVNNFITPPTGQVVTRLGVMVWEGDRGTVGDTMTLNGSTISNTLNPANDVFNSSETDLNTAVTDRTPAYTNLMSLDIDRFDASGILANGATTATIHLATSGDGYYPGIVTFATNLYAPTLTATKTATDVNGGTLARGDQLNYSIGVTNTGGDASAASVLTDAVPAGTTYVPGSLKIGGASVTDASGDDAGNVSGSTVTARIGTAATAILGGTLLVGASTTVAFAVTVNNADVDGSVLSNQATLTYNAATSGAAFTGSSNTVTSNVVVPPALTFPAPPSGIFGASYSDQLTEAGGTAPYAWSVSAGAPPPGIALNTSTGLLSGTPTAVGASSFTVSIVDANGRSDSRAVSFTVADAARDAPTGVTAVAGVAAASVSWTAPAGGPGTAITGYTVTPFVAGVAQASQTFGSTATSQTVTGLTPEVAYTFRVATVNAAGTGANSNPSNAVTPYTVPAAPTAVVATPRSSSASVSWTAPTDNGGSAITGYTVTPYAAGVAQAPQTFSSTATTQTLTGLTVGASYTFAVAAVNGAGTGASSSSSNAVTPFTVPGIPTAVSATAGISSASVSWSAPADNGGSAVTGYAVTPLIAGVAQAPQTFGSAATTQTVTGLTAGVAYTFTVATINAAGTGTNSSASNAVTPYTLPGAPTAVTATAGTKQVTVTWTPPADNGGAAITSYTVTSFIGGVAGTTRTAAADAVSLTFTNLAPGGAYTFTVAANNAAGRGTPGTSGPVVPNANPTVSFPAPTGGTVGTAYRDLLTATGGTGPFTWSVSAGSLPAGLTLDGPTGLLSGTPTAAGSTAFTVQVTDADGVSASRAVTLVVGRATSTLGLTSPSSVDFGTPVTLSARVTPSSATGTVTFDDAPTRGLPAVLGTATISAGVATLTVTLPTFGTHAVTATYSGDASDTAAIATPDAVEVTAYTGEVIVREFRSSGPGGAADSYVELYNAGPAVPMAGFVVRTSALTAVTLPSSAGILGTGRSYLVTGSQYSLTGVTAPDDSAAVGMTALTGVKVVAPDTAGTPTDAVGNALGYHTGAPLATLAGTPLTQWAWVRLESGGVVKDTGSNAADFKLVSVTGGLVGIAQSTLGSPAPSDSASPFQQNAVLQSTLFDPLQGSTSGPNFYYSSSTRTLTVRRTITNTSGVTLNTVLLRITAQSEANGAPEPAVSTQPSDPALMRLQNPATPSEKVRLTSGAVVTVQNLSVSAPATTSPGGGLNTTLNVPLGAGLVSGGSVSVSFSFHVDSGSIWWFVYDVDASTQPPAVPQTVIRSLLHSAPTVDPTTPTRATSGPPSTDAGGHGTLA